MIAVKFLLVLFDDFRRRFHRILIFATLRAATNSLPSALQIQSKSLPCAVSPSVSLHFASNQSKP